MPGLGLAATSPWLYGKAVENKRPTLRSLAAEAGVSAMTVSLALRNSGDVSRATRERIQALAVERGYRPDPAVTRLMHHLRSAEPRRIRASLCGLIDPWPGPDPHRQGYLARLMVGVLSRAQALGYSFTTLNMGDYPTREAASRVLTARGIDGILVLPLSRAADLSSRIDWAGFSVVSVTTALSAPAFHSVMPHHFENLRLACRELGREGCRRIGLAISGDWGLRLRNRYEAAMAWHNQTAGPAAVGPFIDPAPGGCPDPAALVAWILRERPDAVITETLDWKALGEAVRAVPAARRPRLVTMNWPNPVADSGVDQNVERIGGAAIEVLAGLVARGERGVPDLPYSTMVDGAWTGGRRGRARIRIAKAARSPLKDRPACSNP